MFDKYKEEEEEGGSIDYCSSANPIITETPMVWLLHRNNWDLIDVLLDAGVDPLYLSADKTSHTSQGYREYLTYAAVTLKLSCIQRLISAGGFVPESETSCLQLLPLILQDLVCMEETDLFTFLELLMETNCPLQKCPQILYLYRKFAFDERYVFEMDRMGMDTEATLVKSMTDSACKKQVYQSHFKTLWDQRSKYGDHGIQFAVSFGPGNEDSDKDREAMRFFEKFYWTYSRPKSLASLSRTCIRTNIGRIQLRKKVQCLSLLPTALKNYLMYK